MYVGQPALGPVEPDVPRSVEVDRCRGRNSYDRDVDGVHDLGGLDGFGLGDLGFDPGALGDVLSEIQDQAGAVMEAVDAAVDAVQQLSSLAGLADLASISNPLTPLASKVGELGQLSGPVASLTAALGDIQP